MIILKSLQLKNFISHSDTTITFKEDDLLLIEGKSGAGKSSIVEAIVWCLYNEGRVNNKSLIKHGALDMSVTLELFDNVHDITYKIIRKVNNKNINNLEIYVNEEPLNVSGAKLLQNYIENIILHCSYDLFINSVCHLQDSTDTFVHETPAVRKDLLLELLHAEDFDKHLDKIKDYIAILKTRFDEIVGQQKVYMVNIQNEELEVFDISKHEDNVSFLNEIVQSNEKILKNIDYDLSQYSSLKTEKRLIETEINNKNQEADDILNKNKSINDEITKLNSVDISEVNRKIDIYNEANNQLGLLRQKQAIFDTWQQKYNQILARQPLIRDYSQIIEVEELSLKKINLKLEDGGLKEEDCPYCDNAHPCGFEVGILHEQADMLDKKITLLKEEEAKEKKKQLVFSEELAAWKEQMPEKPDLIEVQKYELIVNQSQPLLENWHFLKNRKQFLEIYQNNLIENNQKLEAISKQKSLIQIHLDDINNQLKQIEPLEHQKKMAELELLEKKQQLKTAEDGLMKKKDSQKRIVQMKNNIQELQEEHRQLSEKLINQSLLKDAFSSNGIKAILLDITIPKLEDRINIILKNLSDFSVTITTQKNSVGGDKQIEGLFINVSNGKEMFDFDAYSGGERLKIIVAISEALAEMQNIGFRIFDELFFALDEESSEKFVDAIMSFQANFKQLLCISHLRQVKDIFGNSLMIINQNGNSIVST